MKTVEIAKKKSHPKHQTTQWHPQSLILAEHICPEKACCVNKDSGNLAKAEEWTGKWSLAWSKVTIGREICTDFLTDNRKWLHMFYANYTVWEKRNLHPLPLVKTSKQNIIVTFSEDFEEMCFSWFWQFSCTALHYTYQCWPLVHHCIENGGHLFLWIITIFMFYLKTFFCIYNNFSSISLNKMPHLYN